MNNWGRWGDNDQKGCLNFLDCDSLARGIHSIKHNKALSLALALNNNGPQTGLSFGRINPKTTMVALHSPFNENCGFAFNDDAVEMGLQAATHWDALAHCEYKGKLYNGFSASTVSKNGAQYCDINSMGVIQSRGILLDIAKSKNLIRLPAGYQITNKDLEEAITQCGLTPHSGDIVLIRTGQVQLFLEGKRDQYAVPCAGLSAENALWFHQHQIAAVATDNYVFDAFPFQNNEYPSVHRLCLVEMGLCQGQNWNLEELADVCEKYQQYSFLLTATPEPFSSAVGAPVIPIATL